MRRKTMPWVGLPVSSQIVSGHDAVNLLHQKQKLLHWQSDSQFPDVQTAMAMIRLFTSIQ